MMYFNTDIVSVQHPHQSGRSARNC